MQTSKFTLTYFTFANRAEPIRLAFVLGKIPFQNRAIPFADFPQIRNTFPGGALPILEVETADSTQILTQSNAILRYVGKLAGLYPADPFMAAQVDEAIEIIDEAYQPVAQSIAGLKRTYVAEEDLSEEGKLAFRKRLATKHLPPYLARISKQLSSNPSGWWIGPEVTIADLILYKLTIRLDADLLDGIPSTLVHHDYPIFAQHMERIRSLPEIASYYERHKLPYTDFSYTPPEAK